MSSRISAAYLVTDNELRDQDDADRGGVVLVGIGDNSAPERVADAMGKMKFGTPIHPSAVLARDVVIGQGTVVMTGAIINPAAHIGRHVIINRSSPGHPPARGRREIPSVKRKRV